MAMSKKDFEVVAAVLLPHATGAHLDSLYEVAYEAGVQAVAKDLACAFAVANPRFNQARFLKACGVQS